MVIFKFAQFSAAICDRMQEILQSYIILAKTNKDICSESAGLLSNACLNIEWTE